LICFLYGLHVISIIRTLSINNNTQMSCSIFSHSLFSIVSSILFYLLFSLLFALFHNTLSVRCSNQLRTSGSFLSLTTVLCVSQWRLFLILSQFIILPYILLLVIRIVWIYQFSSLSYYFYFYYDDGYYYYYYFDDFYYFMC